MTAPAIRHPAAFSGPSAHIPSAMSHLPTGGWTTYSGLVSRALKSPTANFSSAPSAQRASYPSRRRE